MIDSLQTESKKKPIEDKSSIIPILELLDQIELGFYDLSDISKLDERKQKEMLDPLSRLLNLDTRLRHAL